MDRAVLVEEARAAGQRAAHNLQVIRSNPEVMLPGKAEDAETYLNTLIRVAEAEMKNDRRPGQSLGLRTRLKYLVAYIVRDERRKRKGETA